MTKKQKQLAMYAAIVVTIGLLYYFLVYKKSAPAQIISDAPVTDPIIDPNLVDNNGQPIVNATGAAA